MTEVQIVSGAEIAIPLNKLKASPKNARRTPHSAEAIEALAASIAAKKMLQKPVVEPELDEGGTPTGFWLVTIGEGRRQAMNLLARRKMVSKACPVACMVETELDAQEISLDENVTRSAMHAADQFEAFRELHERKGWSAEEIAARFGVGTAVVRQRLRLANLSPRLIDLYRAEDLGLDQLMAFAVTDDHARQEQVYEQLSYNRSPAYIRQALTATKVQAGDRRAVFVGVEAYEAAGGTVTRDLFTDDRGGWLDDMALLDRLVLGKLTALAEEEQSRGGWKWAQAHIDYPTGHGLARVYPRRIERSDEDAAQIAALSGEYDALVERYADLDDLPSEAETRLKEIEAALDAFGEDFRYADDEVARGGLFAMLGHDGVARFEFGFIRPEDAASEPQDDEESTDDDPDVERPGDDGDDDAGAPLPDRLVAELTAYRTASLRDALAEHPDVAGLAMLHALVICVFFAGQTATCLDVRCASRALASDAPQIEDAPAQRRHHGAPCDLGAPDVAGRWRGLEVCHRPGRRQPRQPAGALPLAHPRCGAQRSAARSGQVHADDLATAVGLSVAGDWRPDARRYLGRVTKARILEAVTEAAGEAAAQRLALRKTELVEAAEPLVLEAGWLPALLRPSDPEPAAQDAGELAA
ncbi:ParB/RepB/Spo0J family partition protein [Phenylobacterium sp.]|uniref:ParB/RepB/Spo0J family partition protein n=1 Tax=Phenylobacterium sp. TaxID=1871053 RepID=UPI0035AF2558